MFPKQAPHSCQQRVSVLRIIPNALGCWLCLTFNLSTGEPVWKKEKKLMGATQRPWLHLVYLWITACYSKKKEKKAQEERAKNFLLYFLWWDFVEFYLKIKLHTYKVFFLISLAFESFFRSLSLCTPSNFLYHRCDFSFRGTCRDPCPHRSPPNTRGSSFS